MTTDKKVKITMEYSLPDLGEESKHPATSMISKAREKKPSPGCESMTLSNIALGKSAPMKTSISRRADLRSSDKTKSPLTKDGLRNSILSYGGFKAKLADESSKIVPASKQSKTPTTKRNEFYSAFCQKTINDTRPK